ncbi:uncharacterized protein LOC128558499 [Mercenaria mercenaria]|uniref:uncharacterized protein LOC128558499 n=1 Tax=Mercenaria mercenaria TaxID=6596 RepID=UPI00234FB4E5|nr:uncharacterized protein LOC128558499 [Mercenaria mercenaria]
MKAICFLIVLLLTVTACLIGLESLLGYILDQEESVVYPGTLSEFSVSCNDLSLSSDEDFNSFNVKKSGLNISISGDGQYICSGTNLTNLVYLVLERLSRLRLSKGFEEPPYLSCGNESLAPKPGHLLVAFSKISRHQKFSDNDSDAILHWDNHSRNSVIDPSVYYHNGEITIVEGRIYYIYASVYFNISLQKHEKVTHFDKLQQVSVRICRHVYGYEQTLLGRRKLFNISNANAVSSLRIGSHLKLSKNDTIYVKVSNANRLMRNSEGNIFGLFPT